VPVSPACPLLLPPGGFRAGDGDGGARGFGVAGDPGGGLRLSDARPPVSTGRVGPSSEIYSLWSGVVSCRVVQGALRSGRIILQNGKRNLQKSKLITTSDFVNKVKIDPAYLVLRRKKSTSPSTYERWNTSLLKKMDFLASEISKTKQITHRSSFEKS
jgi:hypothetical protein